MGTMTSARSYRPPSSHKIVICRTATVSTTEFELFRALAGRRSRAQVEGYDWTGDRTPYLDVLCVFGPLAERGR